MIPYDTLIIIALCGLIHASFQLSVSMLTLLSGHAIGAGRRQRTLMALTHSFTWGALTMTTLLVATAAYLATTWWGTRVPSGAWAAICGVLGGLGLAVWAFYYRRSPGTTLWLPRGAASFLSRRAKATDNAAEAFSLGLVSVLSELLFVIGPVTAAALSMITLTPGWQMIALGLYAITATSSLIIVNALIGSGHKISHIQAWREHNKQFLQFIAGAALVVLAIYLYSDVAAASIGVS